MPSQGQNDPEDGTGKSGASQSRVWTKKKRKRLSRITPAPRSTTSLNPASPTFIPGGLHHPPPQKQKDQVIFPQNGDVAPENLAARHGKLKEFVALESRAPAPAPAPKGKRNAPGPGEPPRHIPRRANHTPSSSSHSPKVFYTPPEYPDRTTDQVRNVDEEGIRVSSSTSRDATDSKAPRGEAQQPHGFESKNIDELLKIYNFLEDELKNMTLRFGAVGADQSPAHPADALEALRLLEYGHARDKEILARRTSNIEWQKSMKARLGDDWEPAIFCIEPSDEVERGKNQKPTAKLPVVPRLMNGRTFEDGRSPIFAMDNCFNQVYNTDDHVPAESRVGWPVAKEYVVGRATGEGSGSSRRLPVPLENRQRTNPTESSASGTNNKRTPLEYKPGHPLFDRLVLVPVDEQGGGSHEDENEDQQSHDLLLDMLHPDLEDLIKHIESTVTE